MLIHVRNSARAYVCACWSAGAPIAILDVRLTVAGGCVHVNAATRVCTACTLQVVSSHVRLFCSCFGSCECSVSACYMLVTLCRHALLCYVSWRETAESFAKRRHLLCELTRLYMCTYMILTRVMLVAHVLLLSIAHVLLLSPLLKFYGFIQGLSCFL